MMFRRALIAALVLCLYPGRVRGETVQDTQVWSAMLSTAKLSEGPTGSAFWLDTHARRSAGSFLAIVRPGIGWRFSERLSLWAGYAWIPVNPDLGPTTHEHRPWQQIILKGGRRRWAFQSRTRFEQRYRADGDDLAFRARQFLRASQKVRPGRPFGFVVWNETFVGLNDADWGPRQGIDQNRLFLGAAVRVRRSMRLEGGYMNLYLNRDTDVLGHVIATNLFVSL